MIFTYKGYEIFDVAISNDIDMVGVRPLGSDGDISHFYTVEQAIDYVIVHSHLCFRCKTQMAETGLFCHACTSKPVLLKNLNKT